MIEIKSKDGSIVRCVVNEFDYSGVFMGECFITFDIKSPSPIDFSIGDYLDYRGERFTLNYTPAKKKQARNGSYGEAFIYDSLKFNSLSDELTRCRFLDYVSADNNIHFSSLPIFSFYATGVRDLAERIQVNLDRMYQGANKWTVTVDPLFVSKDKDVSVSNISCFDALSLANSEFSANFIISGRIIKIGTSGLSVGAVFGYGKGNGLYDIEQTTNSDNLIITRLMAYGSQRNLPNKYYNKLKKADGTPLIPESQYVTNLMLPSFSVDGKTNFVDSSNIGKYGTREGCVYFDGSDTNLPDIYPSMEGMTASDLISAGIQVSIDSGDNGNLDEVSSAEQLIDNGEIPSTSNSADKPKPSFTITLKDIGFDIDTVRTQEKASISMKSGMCIGREFEITGCKKSGNKYELSCNRSEDTGIGFAYPNSNYQIKAGDKFVLLHIEMPDVYIKSASQRLLSAAKEYISANDDSKYIYTPQIDEVFMARHPELHDTIKEGDIFNFTDSDLGIDAGVIIQSITIHERKQEVPTYEITLNNDRILSEIDKIKNSVSLLSSNASGLTIEQVKSIVSTVVSGKFLSKTSPDSTSHLLKLLGGAEIFEFSKGWLGTGGSVYKNESGKTILEVDGIMARESIVAMEYLFNRVDVVDGELWITFSYGKIVDVDTVSCIAKVELVEDGMLSTKTNDIIRGIFHNIKTGNCTEEKEDANGFMPIIGYTTSYFTPVEMLADGCSFRYALQPGTTQHPCKGMKYAAYGNFYDPARRSSTFISRSREIMLRNVNTWNIDPTRHYGYVKGDLEGIVIGGVALHGYSTCQQGGYLMGTQIQFTPEQEEDMRGHDSYSVNMSSSEFVVAVDSSGKVVSPFQYAVDVVSGVKQVMTGTKEVQTTINRMSARVQAFKAEKELRYSEVMGAGCYLMIIKNYGCEYRMTGGVIVITNVTDTSNPRLEIEVNCEGMAVFNKTFHGTVLLDGISVWSTYHDGEEVPAAPTDDGAQAGWHRDLTLKTVWMSQKNTRLVTDGIWGEPIRIHGVAGDPAFSLNLSNDTDAIACDSDGIPLSSGTLASTQATLYVGGNRVTERVVYAMQATGCTIAETTNATGVVNVTGISKDAAGVLISSLYKEKTILANYSLVKVKGTPVYQLVPSADVIKKNFKGSVAGLSPAAITCGVTKSSGSSISAVSSLPEGFSMQAGAEGALQNYLLGNRLNTADYPSGIVFTLNSGKSVIDKEVIPVIEDGRSAVTIDLTNQSSSVTCDKSGNVVGTIQGSKAVVYLGSSVDSGWTFSARFTGCTGDIAADGTITVSSLTADNASVNVTATKSGYDAQTAVYTISKTKSGADGAPAVVYWIVPSVNAVKKKEDGTLIPSSVTCSRMKQVGSQAAVETSEKSFTYQLSDGSETAYTGAVPVGSAQWVEFTLKDGTTVLDRERIPVIEDGHKGTDGNPGADGNPGTDGKASWLDSTASQLVETGGQVIPSAFTVKCLCRIGTNGAVNPCDDYYLSSWGSSDGSYWVKIESTPYAASTLSVTATAGYKFYSVIASSNPISFITDRHQHSINVSVVKNGADGNPGDPGADAESYWLVPSVTQLIKNTIGNVEPSRFDVKCRMSKKGVIDNYAGLWLSAWKSSDGYNWTLVSSPVQDWIITVTPSVSYNHYLVRASTSSSSSWYDNYALSVSVDMLNNGTDGAAGLSGPAGSMPRMRGEFTQGESYVWDSEFRDIIFCTVGGVNMQFMVGTYGRTVTSRPYSSSQNDADWASANKFEFIATDMLLADGANIAGFMYKLQKMVSQATTGSANNLVLDGLNGKIQIAGNGELVMGNRGSTAYFRFDPYYNRIELYDVSGTRVLSIGLTDGSAWMEIVSGQNKLSMYGNIIRMEYGSRKTVISPGYMLCDDGTQSASVNPDSINVTKGSSMTSISSNSIMVSDGTNSSKLTPLELYFTKSKNTYS